MTDVAQDVCEISQESATKNGRYIVSKIRMHMMMYRMDSDEVRAELQQFNGWSFGRQLAYARNPQDTKYMKPHWARTPHKEAESGRGTGPPFRISVRTRGQKGRPTQHQLRFHP